MGQREGKVTPVHRLSTYYTSGPGLEQSDSSLPPGEAGPVGCQDQTETQQETATGPGGLGRLEAASQPGLEGWGRFGDEPPVQGWIGKGLDTARKHAGDTRGESQPKGLHKLQRHQRC